MKEEEQERYRTGIVLGPRHPLKQLRAREMRRAMTSAEKRLWQQVRDNRLGGLHFRRQQVIEGYIADFYCHEAALVVKVDGAVHAQQAEYDKAREQAFTARSLHVLRFPNARLEHGMEAVLAEILATARQRLFKG